MAVYNGGSFLSEQLESIYRQTHQDWRLLIRDNCSTDSTWAVLEEHARRDPQRIRLLRAQVNGGALANFAALLDHADADYVMFADADDFWFPDKISRTLACMRELEALHSPGTPLLVHADLKVANQDLTVRHDSLWRYQNANPVGGVTLNRLLIQNTVTGCTMMLNRALVVLSRPIPSQPGQVVMHDWWIALVAAAFGHIGRVEQPLMLYRQHGRNDTGARRWTAAGALAKIPRFFDTRELDQALARSQGQAASFLERYCDCLSPAQARLVADYAGLNQRNALARRRLILAHGFYRTGLIRNLSLLLRV
jgi:glycosyltransferase involved in cell wall biosynthesis